MKFFSIVIVTYGREKELSELLDSILKQSLIEALENIIIVDNHPKYIARDIVSKYSEFVSIKYIKNSINSLTSGRSIGANSTQTEVVLFLDDDVLLKDNYFYHLLSFYKKYPYANGMQGSFNIGKFSKTKNFFNKTFWLFNYSNDEYKVYPSIQASYARNIKLVSQCEWFSGTNFSYKRKGLDQIPFDLNLLKYCEGEDIDFSFRAFKRFGELYINPKCKIKHQAAMESREVGEEFAVMQEIYGLYLLNKLFPKSISAKLIYFISRIGKLILFLIDVARFKPSSIRNLFLYIKAVRLSIFGLDIEQFNKEITNEKH